MILYLHQYYGVSIYFGESIEKISDNIKVKTTVITVVPRLIEKYMIKSAKGRTHGIKNCSFGQLNWD
jgi:predicted transcriptional regulator